MSSRRNFIKKGALAIGGVSLLGSKALSAENSNHVPEFPGDTDIDLWNWVRQSYTVSPNIINLNNGGVSPQPKQVQEVFEHYTRLSNEAPSYYMWRVVDKGRESVRRELAELAGASIEEIAINRNSSEALETIIFGIKLFKGDEVIVSDYDYPNMRNAWLQREKREGIKLVWVKVPVGEDDEAKLTKLFTDAMTAKTRIVHITHMINWTGQILPAKKITEEAHKRGLEVVLDAAHSFGQIQFSLHDLGVDYAGVSLHKWLCAPFGTGFIYVKSDKIADLWPLFAPENPASADIRKFEALGTRSNPAEMAIGRAISFHLTIGSARKEARLRFLKNYWVNKTKALKGIKFFTPLSDKGSCALCNVGFEGKEAADIESFLMEKYNIHCVAIKWEGVNGVRITPSTYTSTDDLDLLVEGLTAFSKT
ncbi:MAG: aminotransferase class V-fold PLP-dependent enzyme [Flavobacteriales bacterium]